MSSSRNYVVSKDATTPSNSVDDENSLSSTTITGPELPEGGMEAWCTVFGAFLAQFCGFGYTSAFGVYQAFYAQQYLQNESSSAVSWIGSLATFLVTGIGPMCGPLFDKGYFHHVYIAGAILQSLSIFMLSLVHPGQYYQVLFSQGLVSGIGQGLMYVPSIAILSHHFKRRRTTMMSIVSAGVPLGGVVNSIMLNHLLNGPIGFKMGVRISAAFITVLLFLSCIFMHTRYNTVRRSTTTTVNFWKATKKCFTEVPSLLTILGFTFFQVAYMYPFFYFQLDSIRHDLSVSFAFYSLVIINVGSLVARLVTGVVVPFVGVINLTIVTSVVCAVLIIGMVWLNSIASVVTLGVLYGLFSGINIALMAPVLGLTSGPAELGVRIGVGFAITGIGGLLGSPICGALLTRQYLWWAPALFCGAAALAGGAFFLGVRFSLAHVSSTQGRVRDETTNEREIGSRVASGCESESKNEEDVVKV